MRLEISPAERTRRRNTLRERLTAHQVDGVVLFGGLNVLYFGGFGFIPTERPMALVLAGPERVLFVPRLEVEHAQQHADVDRVVSYPEYPDDRHPMERLAELLAQMGFERARIGVDADGYAGRFGYRGPRLSEVLPAATVVVVRDEIERMQMMKSAEEVALIRESCRWGHLAHALLQEYTRPGLTETEVSNRASHEATLAMIRTLGPGYRAVGYGGVGARAGYRGQIGPYSALPHAMTTNARFAPGDVLVTGASANVGGYLSELERTMVIAPVSDRARRFFGLMLEVQQRAIDAIRPGEPCSAVDRVTRAFFDKYDLWDCWRHHTGHAIGLDYHEAPFLDRGDDRIMEPGMVFTVEPGIYVPGLGGFRHSDTVLVTPNGHEVLTYYPRDLASLTIPA
ncbi:MAG: Xaa-Pro peptidase family protein [Armatimonadota bacterium]|nr:Xaa-Pro peptidase family protein [Armatimonadota bacterium]MDR5696510.1 Xaa-Pro peptidase family protein [Armatimonadota bacterium]